MSRRAMWRLILAPLCSLLIAIASPAIASARVVRVGLYENEPKVYTDDKGRPAGIFVDLLDEIAKDEGWQLKYVPGSWEEDLEALEDGRIDLMPDVAYSVQRDVNFDFHATPVVQSWSNVYAAPGVELSEMADLSGRRVAVLRGSIQQTIFEQMAKGFGYDVTLVPVDSLAEAFKLASGGMVDAAIANNFFGDYFFQQYRLTKTPIAFNAVPLYYATAAGKNADLLDAIDRHLELWLRTPGSPYYQALGRYTMKEPAAGIPRWVPWAVGGAAGLLLLAGAIIWLLRWQVSVKTRSLVDANSALAAAHADLQAAEERLRTALDASNEGIWEWTPKTDQIAWSPRSYTMLGYEPDEFPMDMPTWKSLVHPDDRDAVTAELEQRMATGDRSFWLEYRMRTKSGEWVWIAGRGQVVGVDDEGAAERVTGTNTDIDARKAAEEALAESEARYRSIVETSPDAIFFLDCEGAIRMSNHKVATICGLEDRRALVGRAFVDLLAPEDRAAFEKQRIADPDAALPERRRATMECVEGTRIPVEISAATVTDAKGRPTAIAVTVRDLGARAVEPPA